MSLQISNLSKSFSVRTLFNNVTFSVNPLECVALVGSNGSGKTTLMKILLGKDHPDSGSVVKPKDSTIGYLPQEIFLGDMPEFDSSRPELTLFELVTQAFEPLQQIQKQLKDLESKMADGASSSLLQDQYEHLLQTFERKGGYTWQARTMRLLRGFGFPEERIHDPLNTFSGGWQMRGFFIRLLLSEPDYLLLDEPTNYLDISSITFLEEYLASYSGGILVVSHDRCFLDRLATSVVAIMPEGARLFKGNYSAFLKARELWSEEAKLAQDRQNKEIERVEKFIERFRFKASKASQVQSRIKQLSKIEEVEQYRELAKLNFKFPSCESSGTMVMRAQSLSRAYGENKVLKDLCFTINSGDRVALIGENGAGKTTLMRIIASEDKSYSGTIEFGYRVRFGYFAQDEEISFMGDETVYERMMRETPLDFVPQLRNLLGAFLFSGDEINKNIRILSGGEKSRLGIARMMLHPANLLLLDEPTNHLDINSREALLSALRHFEGTMLIVSHDRFFLDSLVNKILYLNNGVLTQFDGNYSRFLSHNNFYKTDEIKDATQTVVSDVKQVARELHKKQKQLSNRVQRLNSEIIDCEKLIEQHEVSISEVEALLASPPDSYNIKDIEDISVRHLHLNAELENALNLWENLHIELDQTQASLDNLKNV